MFGMEDELQDEIKTLKKENKRMSDLLWTVEGVLNTIIRQKEKFSTMYAEPLLTEVEKWRNGKRK
mgnify:CR=1 FL=1